MQSLSQILLLMRPKQWVKNTFIFFPLIFSGNIFHPHLLQNSFRAFVGFCLVSSSMYILNDLFDRKRDRLHPKKSSRPLAKKEMKGSLVGFIIFVTMAAGLLICHTTSRLIFFAALVYIAIHLAYNLYTKSVVILDVIFIAFGFHIRIWAGSIAAEALPSVWLQMCVFLLALFLGFTKRRYEISTLKEHAAEHRSVLGHYTSYLLDQIIIICSTLAITFYGLYTISSEIMGRVGGYNMVYSIAFVIYGIFRYLYLVHVKKLGDDPGEVLFSDPPMLINVVLWIGYVGLLVYLPRFN